MSLDDASAYICEARDEFEQLKEELTGQIEQVRDELDHLESALQGDC